MSDKVVRCMLGVCAVVLLVCGVVLIRPKLVVSRGNDMKDIVRSIAAMVAAQMSAALRASGNRDGTVDLGDYRPEREEVE